MGWGLRLSILAALFLHQNLYASTYSCAKLLKNILQGSVQNPWYSKQEIYPGFFHIKFKSQKLMAYSMLRFQEFYENPKFSGEIFSHEEYKKYSLAKNTPEQKREFQYFKVDGFNFPGYILKTFWQGYFNPLLAVEEALIHEFETIISSGKKFYIIATAENVDPRTMDHEIAHWLFATQPEYRSKVLKLLSEYDIRDLRFFIANKIEGYEYAEHVLDDEAHAWLSHNKIDLEDLGFNAKSLEKLHEDLNLLYKEYKSKL